MRWFYLYLLLVILSLAAIVPAIWQSAAQNKQLSTFELKMLAEHNNVRQKYNVQPLTWDDSLAAFAQEWANKISADGVKPPAHREGSPYGENFSWGTAGALDPRGVLERWEAETQNYDRTTNTCALGRSCMHFTQVVWSTTTRVGCGKARSADGQTDFLVCNYSPPGNSVGQSPFPPTSTPTQTPSCPCVTATPTPTPNNLPKTKTYVIPHILEKSGTINNTQFTFDTSLFATYTAGLGGTPAGATLDLYLFDQPGGAPLKNNGEVVCNPCSYKLDSSTRKQSIRIEDLISAKGAFDKPVKLGFGVIVVGGDVDNVSLNGFIVNSHTGPFDLSVFDFEPIPVGVPKAKTFTIPHILEKSGTINNTQFTFDTDLFATYTAGLGGTPPGPGATLDLYLLDQPGGAPLKNNGEVVCDPCSFKLDSSTRKQSIQIDDLITAKGTFDKIVKLGFGVIVVGGDVDYVSLQALVANSHTSPFDLGLFGMELIPLPQGAWRR